MFVTPNDDASFRLFTVNHYTGSDPKFFEKLAPSRRVEAKTEKKPYDRRKFSPFRGNVRTEDIACQGTQPLLDQRSEQLATSDKGVILIRKIILNAVRAAQRGDIPKGIPSRDDTGEMISIDSFTGIRAKGGR
jgi:hypothetical protein